MRALDIRQSFCLRVYGSTPSAIALCQNFALNRARNSLLTNAATLRGNDGLVNRVIGWRFGLKWTVKKGEICGEIMYDSSIVAKTRKTRILFLKLMSDITHPGVFHEDETKKPITGFCICRFDLGRVWRQRKNKRRRAPDAAKAVTTAEAGGPAIIFDAGGKFDKSFNESGYNGAEEFKKETGKSYLDFELKNPAELEGVLRKMAQRGGNPIVTMGFNSAEALGKVSAELPKSNFVIIDSEVAQPNVKSVQFREEEGSYLVGALAAMKSASGKVGFIGGMDIPVIRKFACGFEQGAKHVNPKAEVIKNTVGDTGEAWNNPTKGGELAKAQFGRGVDVIFAAAGGTGIGVYQAAKDNKKYAIGVDSNQNYLQPGTMLTSMVKRVDVAVKNAFTEAASGKFTGGSVSLGLAENGVDWALDKDNRELVTPEMEAKVNAIKADIVSGKIKITCDGK